MRFKQLFAIVLLPALAIFSEGLVFAQGSKLEDLSTHLTQKAVSRESIPTITQHLTDSGNLDYLDELVNCH